MTLKPICLLTMAALAAMVFSCKEASVSVLGNVGNPLKTIRKSRGTLPDYL